jgi:murein DD-endopeptidase MepM/ murein hydrolase activator NlpD
MKRDTYGFLISYGSRSEIRIRRIEVPTKKIKSNLAGLFYCFFVLAVASFASSDFDKVFSQIKIGESFSDFAFAGSQASLLQFQSEQERIDSGGPVIVRNLDSENYEYEKDIGLKLKEVVSMLDPELIPNLWPREDKINNEFGFRNNPFGGRTYEFHEGIDIGGERGDSVVAAGGGRIIKAGWQGGYGNLIEIDHGGGLTTRYGHLMKIQVEVGDFVSKGQQIGLVGSTGRSTGPHLHFELRLNDKAIDPRKLLPSEQPE